VSRGHQARSRTVGQEHTHAHILSISNRVVDVVGDGDVVAARACHAGRGRGCGSHCCLHIVHEKSRRFSRRVGAQECPCVSRSSGRRVHLPHLVVVLHRRGAAVLKACERIEMVGAGRGEGASQRAITLKASESSSSLVLTVEIGRLLVIGDILIFLTVGHHGSRASHTLADQRRQNASLSALRLFPSLARDRKRGTRCAMNVGVTQTPTRETASSSCTGASAASAQSVKEETKESNTNLRTQAHTHARTHARTHTPSETVASIQPLPSSTEPSTVVSVMLSCAD
jgi:hypothetical protein